MIRTLDRADQAALGAFSDIIDVRSPAEFAEDHVPGAVNLPVLNDAERALIGTAYVKQSRFEARRAGAAIVARNIAAHLEGALGGKPPSFCPLVYCWRGGQRSAAMATVLDQVGWRPTLLEGGYKTYRRTVNAFLHDRAIDLRIVLLSGHTGTAKTAILAEVFARGGQILDLEHLANHRGSLLGGFSGVAQPSQKMFESTLATKLAALDWSRPVLLEAESSKIGEINLPEQLWKAMAVAPMIEVRAPPDERAKYLAHTYGDIAEDPARLKAALERLPGRHGLKRLNEWLELSGQGDFRKLALKLMEAHYDPAYSRWMRNHGRERLADIELHDLTASSIGSAADISVSLMRILSR